MMEQQYLESPQQQTFWQILALSLHTTSVLDQRWWGFGSPNKLSFLISKIFKYFTPVALVSQIVYMVKYYETMHSNQIETILTIVLITILVNVKIISSRTESYNNTMKHFMNEFHLYNHQTDVFTKKKLISREKYTRWTAYTLAFFISLDCVLVNFVPIYYNIVKKELIANRTAKLMTTLYMVMPFDYEYDYKNWLIMHCINMYSSAVACYLLIVFDTACYAIIFHVIGHFEILKHKIKDFLETFGHLNEREVHQKIVELIDYHSFVLRVFKNVEAAYGLNVTANYLFNLVIDSFLLYEVMTREKEMAIIFSVMFMVFMGGLILMSFVLEEIRKQSEGLADAVYGLPWDKMSISHQKMMILILARVQPTISFVGAGGMETGVQPMLRIMKSTFSYYVMLKSKIE